jgi:aldehyde dehydrogenase (NAD+)
MALAYAPSLESTPVRIASRYDHFIGGTWQPSSERGTFATVNPATGAVLSEVAQGTAADIDRAVAAARQAYERVWKPMRPAERAKYVYRIARAITERSRELAVLETMDGGKPIKESRDFDVVQAAAHFFYYAGWADKLRYAFAGRDEAEPLGVVGAIVPWNFPLLMAAWKIAPAIACGQHDRAQARRNDPADRAAAGRDLRRGRAAARRRQHRHRRRQHRSSARRPSRRRQDRLHRLDRGRQDHPAHAGRAAHAAHLELGGKAANIVFADAPLDQAIEGIVNGIYFNQGHVCCAGSRLLVQESIHDEVVERLERAHRDAAPRRSARQEHRHRRDQLGGAAREDRRARAERHRRRRGLASADRARCPNGMVLPASFFTGVSPSHRIAREEIFGPVLSIMTFRTADEAIEKANNTPYGLSAGVWTDKGAKAMYVAQRLQAGVVWCSTFNQFDPSSPFGGYRESGFGREGGIAGLRPYLS